MAEYGKSLEKTSDTSPKIGGFSVVQSIEDSRKCMRDKYVAGLVSDIQLQDFECSLDARLADYRDSHGKAVEGLRTGRETVYSDSKAKSSLLRQETGTLWDVLPKVRSLKNLPKDMLVGEAKGISKGVSAVYDGTKNLLVGTGEFIGESIAAGVHGKEWEFLQYTTDKTAWIRTAVNTVGNALAITVFEAINGDQSVIIGAIQYWKEKGVELAKLPADAQVAAVYNFQTQVVLGIIGSKWLWAVSKPMTLSDEAGVVGKAMHKLLSPMSREISMGGKGVNGAISLGAKIWAEVLGLDSSVLSNSGVGNIKHTPSPHDALNRKLDISPRIVHEIEGTTLILKDIPPMSPKELERDLIRIMREHPGKEIRFDDSISPEAKRALATIIYRNHPLSAIVRLLPWSDIVNITFGGIKPLNDTYGQEFVNRFMDIVRGRMNATFQKYADDLGKGVYSGHARGIRTDDYKNFTVALPPGASLEQVLFSGADSKQAFIEEVIRSARQDIEKIAREKKQTPEQVEAAIRANFGFRVGKSSVPEGAGNMDKLQAFYEAEMNSRKGLETDRIEAMFSDPIRIEQYAREVMAQKAEILKNWEGKTFVFEEVEYPAVIKTFGTNKLVLHPQLLRQVRKWPEAVMPPELAGAVRTYIDTLNKGFDFIAPTHNPEEDFRKAHAFNADFQNGIIKPEAILYTYKGTLSKEAFFGLTEGKPGMRDMTDIKDMGLANFASFEKIAEKVASGEYTWEDLLGAGKEVTEQFIHLVEKVRHDHPDVQISLGGDELNRFLGGVTPNQAESILTSLHNNLGRVFLEGRIGHSFESENSREVFARLDNTMNIHKKLEALIEKELSNNMPSEQHKTIIVHINKEVPSETNFLGLIKWAQVQGIIKAMMRSVKEGKTLLHETLRLSEGINIDFGYVEGKFQLVFNR